MTINSKKQPILGMIIMAKDFNHPKVVENYDEHIRSLIPAYELVHLQIQAILTTHLKSNAKILIAGCGTGYELQYLANQFPEAQFVAIDPSLNMIESAKQRLAKTTDIDRVTFIHGDTSILADDQYCYCNEFDAVLTILVAHFLAEPAKTKFFNDLNQSLKKQGVLITYDLMQMDQCTQQILFHLTQYNGLTEKQSVNMIDRLEDDFALIDAAEMKKNLMQCGFENVHCYMQILGFHGFYAYKASGNQLNSNT